MAGKNPFAKAPPKKGAPAAPASKKAPPKFQGYSSGGTVRGAGVAVRGKKYSHC